MERVSSRYRGIQGEERRMVKKRVNRLLYLYVDKIGLKGGSC